MKIGFIGLGHMGNPMARNLLKHGHTLKVYDVVPELVKKLTDMGCEAATSRADCGKGVEVVITMLPSSPHVSSVYSERNGLLDERGARHAADRLLDHRSAHRARSGDGRARRKSCPMVDAPVSGGVGGAEAGTLTFMVGGEAKDFEARQADPASMGKNIVHCGGAGNGQVAKICNNMMLAIEMIATVRGHDARREARHGPEGLRRHRQHLQRSLLELGHLQPLPRRAGERARLARLHGRLRRRPDAEGPDARHRRGQVRAAPGDAGRAWRSRSTRSIPSTATARKDFSSVILQYMKQIAQPE